MTVFLIILAYLMGSIPTGVILARTYGNIDLRKVGSGNIGATNVGRILGRKFGVTTLLGDMVKGLVPVLLARWLIASELLLLTVALAAFLGHLYPIFLEFKGGKGIATALGVFLGLTPLAAILAFGLWLVCFIVWRISSLSSLIAATAMPIIVGLLNDSRLYLVFSLIITALIFYTHRENIQRLAAGEET
ncbi:MAG: glycerol-3-phosphate 1-O-acyltransferase PlsY [Deltaproteobacteria bacterium]|nr:MAG: glycerol-3-phosphate 1-O-acyltransferase PlsY [Deltaproteobacteria bacterium]